MSTAYIVAYLRPSKTGAPRVHDVRITSEWPHTIARGMPTPALLGQASGSTYESARWRAIQQSVALNPWTAPFFAAEERRLRQMTRVVRATAVAR